MTGLLPARFDRDFRDALRAEAREAYALVGTHYYRPDHGADALIFGLMIFKNLDRRFAARFTNGSAFAYTPTIRGPELRDGTLRVRWKKVGDSHSAPDDVERPSDVMIEMAEANLSPQLSLGLDAEPLRNWVIAHAGTPRDGLLTMHLAAPEMASNGKRVVAWRESIAIYSALDPAADFPEIAAPALPEAVELPELEVTFLPDEADAAADAD